MARFVHSQTTVTDLPADVLAEVDAAWERAQELIAGELELHFNVARVSGRVTGELRIPGGAALERLSAYESLMLACGKASLARTAA
jgi:hypothetical protein